MADTTITGIDISTYTIKDFDRAMTFWRDTMGLTPTHVWEGMGAEFVFGDDSTFGIWKMDGGSPGSGIMFRVADVAAAVDELRAKGVQFEGGGDEGYVDETPVCFMAFGKDTEGNSFILHQRKT